MDRLIEVIEDKQNPSVVGLDPTEALVPKQVVASFAEEIAEQVEDDGSAGSPTVRRLLRIQPRHHRRSSRHRPGRQTADRHV